MTNSSSSKNDDWDSMLNAGIIIFCYFIHDDDELDGMLCDAGFQNKATQAKIEICTVSIMTNEEDVIFLDIMNT